MLEQFHINNIRRLYCERNESNLVYSPLQVEVSLRKSIGSSCIDNGYYSSLSTHLEEQHLLLKNICKKPQVSAITYQHERTQTELESGKSLLEFCFFYPRIFNPFPYEINYFNGKDDIQSYLIGEKSHCFSYKDKQIEAYTFGSDRGEIRLGFYLPNSTSSMDQLIDNLSFSQIKNWNRKLQRKLFDVFLLPRIDIEDIFEVNNFYHNLPTIQQQNSLKMYVSPPSMHAGHLYEEKEELEKKQATIKINRPFLFVSQHIPSEEILQIAVINTPLSTPAIQTQIYDHWQKENYKNFLHTHGIRGQIAVIWWCLQSLIEHYNVEVATVLKYQLALRETMFVEEDNFLQQLEKVRIANLALQQDRRDNYSQSPPAFRKFWDTALYFLCDEYLLEEVVENYLIGVILKKEVIDLLFSEMLIDRVRLIDIQLPPIGYFATVIRDQEFIGRPLNHLVYRNKFEAEPIPVAYTKKLLEWSEQKLSSI